jgi:hypothetical protein
MDIRLCTRAAQLAEASSSALRDKDFTIEVKCYTECPRLAAIAVGIGVPFLRTSDYLRSLRSFHVFQGNIDAVESIHLYIHRAFGAQPLTVPRERLKRASNLACVITLLSESSSTTVCG